MFDAYVSPWRTRSDVTGTSGWFPSGDIAVADEEGYVTLVGRSKSVISVGGLKFFPEEVELVLRSQAGVLEARVFAIDHPSFGSVPVAEVLPAEGAVVVPGELLKRCRRDLARFKVPVEVRIVDSIPRTPSGKIRRT
jgi:long-chain acyl-CoA synthetase